MARRCFFSFHYQLDSQRAAQVRSIGAIDGNPLASDNDWEAVLRGGAPAIQRWIDTQLIGRSCTIVLVGQGTAGRPWIEYEIKASWNKGMGVVGVRIHGLKNLLGQTSSPGPNPFAFASESSTNANLASIVKCYDPPGWDSKQRYGWIAQYLSAMVEEAIEIRRKYP